ncbi:MAG: orotate phosphoribosyltransferase [Nitrospiria bacterium]
METVERLRHIILRQSFQYREEPTFKLSSGASSHFYFDCKKTTLDPVGSSLIGEILYERTKNFPISGAGGLTLGADNLASVLMYTAFRHGKQIPQFIVRKDLKKHGAVKWVEGTLKQGDSVLVLDDVVTTGDSVITAIERVQEDGLKVYGVIVLIDREEFGGIDKIQQVIPGKPVDAIITRSEIMDLYRSNPADPSQSDIPKLRYA